MGGLNLVWLIVDKFTKVALFILMKNAWSMEKLVEAYANDIIRLHSVPTDIVWIVIHVSCHTIGRLYKKHWVQSLSGVNHSLPLLMGRHKGQYRI